MAQEIIYGGYTANPSDYESADGDLALSLNLIHEDDQLKPVFPSKEHSIVALQSGDTLLCVHTRPNSGFPHYIIHSNNGRNSGLYYIDSNGKRSTSIADAPTEKPTKAVCVGNTVALTYTTGVCYLLWNTNDSGVSSYKFLSGDFPEVKMSFGLHGCLASVTPNDIVNDYQPYDSYANWPLTWIDDTLNNQVLASVNKLIAKIRDDGHFSMPFFVRYAYRLFDGTLTRQSAPILMLPSNEGKPIALCTNHKAMDDTEEKVRYMGIAVFAPSCQLNAEATICDGLENYSDIIKSVDIFISAPLYTYDQDGRCSGMVSINENNSFGIFSEEGFNNTEPNYDSTILKTLERYSRRSIYDTCRIESGFQYQYEYGLPTKSDEAIHSQLSDCSNFYLVKSIPIDKLPSERKDIVIDGDILENLVAREVMTDDYNSHNIIHADNLFSYNSRLLASGITNDLYKGYYEQPFAETLLTDLAFENDDPSTEGKHRWLESITDSEDSCIRIYDIYTYIKRDGNVFILKQSFGTDGLLVSAAFVSSTITTALCVPFFYHPDSYAYKAEVIIGTNSLTSESYTMTLNLKPHDTLNGAYYFDDFLAQTRATITTPTPTTDNTISLPNRIYVSEVNNPFVFPTSYIVSVGSGSVIGMATATQALSMGQFGSFPLYALTTDGVWALSVSDTGTFSAVQPISRDVCTDADSITQLDNDVVFASARGLMDISGSAVACITSAIECQKPFNAAELPYMADLHKLLDDGTDTCIDIQPFLTFLDGCRMAFDYIRQRIIIFNPTIDSDTSQVKYAYAYVLSLKSKQWGMVRSQFIYAVNDYPDTLLVDVNNKVYSISEVVTASPVKGLFLTRPIKFGQADVMKTIHSVFQRGNFAKYKKVSGTVTLGSVNTVLYASRDNVNWFMLASSKSERLVGLRGMPWKYYRIAGIATLSDGESLSGATIDVEAKETTSLH